MYREEIDRVKQVGILGCQSLILGFIFCCSAILEEFVPFIGRIDVILGGCAVVFISLGLLGTFGTVVVDCYNRSETLQHQCFCVCGGLIILALVSLVLHVGWTTLAENPDIPATLAIVSTALETASAWISGTLFILGLLGFVVVLAL